MKYYFLGKYPKKQKKKKLFYRNELEEAKTFLII